MESRLDNFKRLKECDKFSTLYGDNLIVERIESAEMKTRSGLVIAESANQVNSYTRMKPTFCRVLEVGTGYYDDETKEPVEMSVKPGDIILVANESVRWYSSWMSTIFNGDYMLGRTRESEIIKLYDGQEGFDSEERVLALDDVNTR